MTELKEPIEYAQELSTAIDAHGTWLYTTGYWWHRAGFMPAAPVDYPAWSVKEDGNGKPFTFYPLGISESTSRLPWMQRISMEVTHHETGEKHVGRWVGWSCPYYDVPTQNYDVAPEDYSREERRITEPLCLMVAAIDERTHEGEGGEVSFNIVPREYGDEASTVVEDEDGTLWVGTPTRVIITLQ